MNPLFACQYETCEYHRCQDNGIDSCYNIPLPSNSRICKYHYDIMVFEEHEYLH